MSAGWWPVELKQEMETENFYMYDTKTIDKDVIKVYPSLNTTVTGLSRYMRNVVKDTSLFGIALAVYNRECEMLYEGDEVSIFGKVVYNVKNDEFTFDKCFSMF